MQHIATEWAAKDLGDPASKGGAFSFEQPEDLDSATRIVSGDYEVESKTANIMAADRIARAMRSAAIR